MPEPTVAAIVGSVYNYGPDIARLANGSGEGVVQDLSGNDLPNAPEWTISLGAQYRWDLPGGWNATLRGDYYRQSESYMRYNNAFFDRIEAWENVNASLIFAKPEIDLNVQFFVKNLLDDDTIVGFDINDENLGATRSVFLLDPRLYGVAITKGF